MFDDFNLLIADVRSNFREVHPATASSNFLHLLAHFSQQMLVKFARRTSFLLGPVGMRPPFNARNSNKNKFLLKL